MPNWKRISEEMPPPNKVILFITNMEEYLCLGFYDDDTGYFYPFNKGSYCISNIKAWCHIPDYDLNL